MQQHRIISLLSIVIMLVIPVIGWFLVAQPQLAAATSADQQRVETESQIEAGRLVVAQLKADTAKLPELNDELNKLRTSIPAGVDSSGYIDGLDALAQLSGVLITGLTVADPVVYVPAQPPLDPAAAEADTTETDGEADAADAATTPPPVADPAIVTSPLIDSSNFLAVEVSVETEGSYSAILDFIDGVQSSPRLFLVTGVNISEDQQRPGTFIGTTYGFIYAIPTGVEGKPRPISTTVKTMTPPEPVVTDEDAEEGTDGESGGASPDPSSTPAP
jgi:Tfp pilus assembly protein PilO